MRTTLEKATETAKMKLFRSVAGYAVYAGKTNAELLARYWLFGVKVEKGKCYPIACDEGTEGE
jgi:hypothetical protein